MSTVMVSAWPETTLPRVSPPMKSSSIVGQSQNSPGEYPGFLLYSDMQSSPFSTDRLPFTLIPDEISELSHTPFFCHGDEE
jgi:hypothetical protein